MIPMLASALMLAAALPSPEGGLISTGQMTVRAVVADRCTVSPAGAACQGAAPIRPMAVRQDGSSARVAIIF